MTTNFHRATKAQAKLRLAITGPSGSGKTYTALTIAGGLGNSIAVIDTERGSASKYADLFQFDVLELTDYHPRNYIEAIKAAHSAGYDVLVIDSLSHAWSGQGGILEMVDNAAKRSQSQNKFAAWRDATPWHNQLVDTILGANIHVIATMRSKTEYVLEKDERGKTSPRKVGLAPVQRDGMEFEFDIVAEMDMENTLMISKSRCIPLTNAVISRPTIELGMTLKAWVSDGAPQVVPNPPPLTPVKVVPPSPPSPAFDSDAAFDAIPRSSADMPAADALPQTLGDLKRMVIVERKWATGEASFRALIATLKEMGEIENTDDYPAVWSAIERYKMTSEELAASAKEGV